MKNRFLTLEETPTLEADARRLDDASWPTFMLNSDVEHWSTLYDRFKAYQLLLCDTAGGLLAVGHTVPVTWNETEEDLPETITEIFERGLHVDRGEAAPNALAAVAAMVRDAYRGRGLSTLVVRAMLALAAQHRFGSLIAPVRPTEKCLYPLAPMEHYVEWKREDGAPFDPWIRVHWRLGAVRLKVARATLRVEGTVAQWERWTGQRFPESGSHTVPGALQPVVIDREEDRGQYSDPNLWMLHRVGSSQDSKEPL